MEVDKYWLTFKPSNDFWYGFVAVVCSILGLLGLALNILVIGFIFW